MARSAPLAPPPATFDPHKSATPDSPLLLVLDAFNATLRILLEQDSKLVHPRATFVEHGPHGDRRETMLRPRVFRGKVFRTIPAQTSLHESRSLGVRSLDFLSHMSGSPAMSISELADMSTETEHVGSAFIVLSDPEHRVKSRYRLGTRSFGTEMPAFYGHFDIHGNVHRVGDLEGYRRAKRSEDAEPAYRDSWKNGLYERSVEDDAAGSAWTEGRRLVIWRESDRKDKHSQMRPRGQKPSESSSPGQCAVDHPESSDLLATAGKEALHRRLVEEFGADYASSPLYKRDSVAGCPAKLGESMLYMTAVADCNYVSKHGGTTQARNAIINTWAQVSTIYEKNFNIYVGLISVEIFGTCSDPTNATTAFNQACSAGYTITQRLSDFSEWRGSQTSNISQVSGLYHLMSTCATGAQVGIAWLNTLCQKSSFSQADNTYKQLHVSGTGVSAIAAGIQDESKVVAHEIGHNFGSIVSVLPVARISEACQTNKLLFSTTARARPVRSPSMVVPPHVVPAPLNLDVIAPSNSS